MQFQVLHAEECFVEAANHTEEPASPNRPRGLPRTLQSQEAQQIVARILGMIQARQIPHRRDKNTRAEYSEVQGRISLHDLDAPLETMGPKQVIGINKDDEPSSALRNTDVAADISPGRFPIPLDVANTRIASSKPYDLVARSVA